MIEIVTLVEEVEQVLGIVVRKELVNQSRYFVGQPYRTGYPLVGEQEATDPVAGPVQVDNVVHQLGVLGQTKGVGIVIDIIVDQLVHPVFHAGQPNGGVFLLLGCISDGDHHLSKGL